MTIIRFSASVEVSDIASFCAGVLEILRYWRDVHTHEETWITENVNRDFFGKTINLEEFDLGNTYYEFDKETFKTEYIKAHISQSGLDKFYRCPECGSLSEDNTYCTGCGEELDSPDSVDDEDVVEEFIDFIDFSAMEISLVQTALKGRIFRDYEISLSGVISDILEKVEFYIEKLENSPTNLDKLTSTIEALSLAHTSGEIFKDYLERGMYGFEVEQILNVRENGIESEFDREDIKEWLEG
jgi:hypothetical protein